MKLLENNEPDSAEVSAFASSAEQMSLVLFEMFLCLQELSKYKIYVNERFLVRLAFFTLGPVVFLFRSFRSELKLNQYFNYFGIALKKWLIVIRSKVFRRIEEMIEKDKSEGRYPNSATGKFSPSSFEICQCLTQICHFWKRLGRTKNERTLSKEEFRSFRLA